MKEISDITLLSLFMDYNVYKYYRDYLNVEVLEPEIQRFIYYIDEYFRKPPTKEVTPEDFRTWFLHCGPYTKSTENQQELYKHFLDRIVETKVSPEMAEKVISYYQSMDTRRKIQEVLDKKVDVDKILQLLDEHQSRLEAICQDDEEGWVPNDILRIATSTQREHGLGFRLDCLNKSLNKLIKGDFGIIAAYVDTGKCLAKGTPIMMYDGSIKKVEDVQIGDKLMGDDSTPRTVLSLARGREKMYKIHQKNGDDYIVNESHILSLKYCDSNVRFSGIAPYSVVDMPLKDYLEMPLSSRNYFKGFKVPVDMEKKEVPLDPYFLGLWLGDGHAADTRITNMDSNIINYYKNYGETLGCTFNMLKSENTGRAKTYSLTTTAGQKNPLLQKIQYLGLQNNKHIPELYLCNDRPTRERLLAGLMDTDGSFSGYYEITQKRKELSLQILRLVRSLGMYASMNEKIINGVPYYRVHFIGDTTEIPFLRLPQYSLPKNSKRKGLHYSISIEELKEDDYYGFTIDGNRRFLLGDCTVTHNTTAAISEATFMAQQITDGCVLWLNNEEFDDRVWKKIWQATLGQPWNVIEQHPEKAAEAYKKKMHGDMERIKLIDIRGMSLAKIKRLFKKHKPKLAIIDQIDKIYSKQGKDGKEHERLKHLYGDVRSLANEYCPIIAISQADASTRWMDRDSEEVRYQKYIDQSQLDGSKVGKPGEADFIITIGKDSCYPSIRYIHVAKNKMDGVDERYRSIKAEVKFNGQISRYENP